jgi:hypothetical protein
MIFYLTYNEAPSGIFSSQVIDVVKFLESSCSAKIKLVSFISLRGFSAGKQKIKQELPDAIVLPMFPKMINWEKNKFLLSLFCKIYKPKKIIARSVMATKLALLMRVNGNCNSVVYDGRGAIEAEWREYKVVDDEHLLNVISVYEEEVVLKSDFRIAVSNALVDFWKDKYSYSENKHVLIPCTLNSDFENVRLLNVLISDKRKELKLQDTDTVFVYSGSVAGWQSFDILFCFIEPILKKSDKNKIVFFSPQNSNLDKLQNLFPQQVVRKPLNSNQVAEYLIVGDYGLLIRENSVTNQVASPVKFAEYLACGLKVIISEDLGDYTQLSARKNWGYLYTNFNDTILKPDVLAKQKISQEAINFFSKKNYLLQYKQLLSS